MATAERKGSLLVAILKFHLEKRRRERRIQHGKEVRGPYIGVLTDFLRL